MKKVDVSRGLEVFSHFDFFLSPYEFLGIVWIYRNEIKPLVDKLIANGEAPCLKQCDRADLARKLRTAIVNSEIRETEFSNDEKQILARTLPCIFAPFAEESAPVRKPDRETLDNLRSVVADLINYDKLGSYYSVESSMVNGKIKFKVNYQC